VILAVLATIAIPNFTRWEVRAKESEVKSVTHSVQMAVEDYKATPGWEGSYPSTASELQWVAQYYLPSSVQSKKNPFNLAEDYGTVGSGLRYFGEWGAGRIHYAYSIQMNIYTIVAEGGTTGVSILTLMEGQ
jgi:type II secretory pathway pseudopilin PulG